MRGKQTCFLFWPYTLLTFKVVYPWCDISHCLEAIMSGNVWDVQTACVFQQISLTYYFSNTSVTMPGKNGELGNHVPGKILRLKGNLSP